MHQKQKCFFSTYALNGLSQLDEHPVYAPLKQGTLYILPDISRFSAYKIIALTALVELLTNRHPQSHCNFERLFKVIHASCNTWSSVTHTVVTYHKTNCKKNARLTTA